MVPRSRLRGSSIGGWASIFSLEYTLNGASITKTGINENPYTLSEEPGNYVLLNVSSGQCSKTLSSGTLNATISEHLQPLQTFHE